MGEGHLDVAGDDLSFFWFFLFFNGCMCFGPSSRLSQWAALMGGHNMCNGGEE